MIGDMISPFKAAVGGDYKLVEARLKRAVLIRFGLTAEPSDDLERRIKVADRASAYLEATALAGFSIAEARKLFGEPDPPIRDFAAFLEPMRPADVEAQFLTRFAELDAEAGGTRKPARDTIPCLDFTSARSPSSPKPSQDRRALARHLAEPGHRDRTAGCDPPVTASSSRCLRYCRGDARTRAAG